MSDKNRQTRNVEPDTIPLLSWNDQDKEKSIEVLYRSVQEKYFTVINWYLERKSGKMRFAQWLRSLSIIFAILSVMGFFVMTISIHSHLSLPLSIISSMLLILAAGFIAFDRFFGFSSSWIRFILTSLVLQKELNSFQMDFNQLSMDETQNLDKILLLKMQRIKQAYEFLYSRLEGEAHQWAEEFRGNLDRSVTDLVAELKTSGASTNGTPPGDAQG